MEDSGFSEVKSGGDGGGDGVGVRGHGYGFKMGRRGMM